VLTVIPVSDTYAARRHTRMESNVNNLDAKTTRKIRKIDLKKLLLISQSLTLPLSFVTSTQAILAKKRVGKSYTAQVQAEELLRLRQQVVVLDPTDAWWGLRSSADGKEAGYPITIFGGRHGDWPLAADAGAAMAEAIVEEGFSCVISLKLFTKSERLRFAADFLETLYRINRKAMHLFIDEADVFAPQKTWDPAQARCLGAADEIVRRGGIDGIGITLITQRSAVLNKDVLSQVDQLVVLRMNHPKDMKPIKDWLGEHMAAATIKEMMSTLASLPKGHAWVWAPELEPPIFERVVIREKRTFDSGRTPKAGERRKEPKRLAKVDLARIGAKLAESVERVKANDPKQLRAELAKLRAELAKEQKRTEPKQPKDRIVEKRVEFVKPADIRRMETVMKRAEKIIARIAVIEERLGGALTGIRMEVTTVKDIAARVATFTTGKGATVAINSAGGGSPRGATISLPGASSAKVAAAIEVKESAARSRPVAPAPERARSVSVSRSSATDADSELPPGETATLRALIQHRDGLEKKKLRVLTGYKRSSSNSYIQRLMVRGFVSCSGEKVTATAEGVAAMPNAEPLPTGQDLIDHWRAKLPPGERTILDELITARGLPVLNDELGKDYSRSSRNSYLQRLKAKNLVEKEGATHKAAAVLFQ
jgi:hypothetical protein